MNMIMTGENPVPVPLCLPHIQHKLASDRTRASAVTGRRLNCPAVTNCIQCSVSSGRVLLKRYPRGHTDLLIRNYAVQTTETDPAFPVAQQQYRHTAVYVTAGWRSSDSAGRGAPASARKTEQSGAHVSTTAVVCTVPPIRRAPWAFSEYIAAGAWNSPLTAPPTIVKVNRLGRETNHTPSAAIKNAWSHTFPPIRFYGMVLN